MNSESEERYELLMPFWTDTDAYTERDRVMFGAGVEFKTIWEAVKGGWTGTRPVSRENESRLRMMCARLHVQCTVLPDTGYEGCDHWSTLTIEHNECRPETSEE